MASIKPSRTPNEGEVLTGPSKSQGGDRRHFVALTDQLKQAFAHIVLSERGDKLTVPLGEVTQGQIFSGVEGVRLGLIDAIGGRSGNLFSANRQLGACYAGATLLSTALDVDQRLRSGLSTANAYGPYFQH